MGFFSDVVDSIRKMWHSDKERVALNLSQSSTGYGDPLSHSDLLQAYGYDVLADYLRLENDLLSRFVDAEDMDDYPEITSTIDIYADDATQVDSHTNRTVWATSKDKKIEKIVSDDLFNKLLRLDEEAWEIARTTCKYGNDYEELLVTDEGVRGLNFMPPPTVRRVEGPRGELYGFVQDFRGKFGYGPKEFKQLLDKRLKAMEGGRDFSADPSGPGAYVAPLEDWEVVHFRLRGKHRRSVYGYSVLEGARWIWKRMMLIEDAALIYRLQRAAERFAFYVDVGELPPREAFAYVNRVRQQHRKRKFVNPSSNKLDLKYDSLSQDDDFYIPVRRGVDSTRIEVLGAPSWQHMEDVEYFRDKMFAALKVPKAYLAQDEQVNRASLSSEDVRFARTVLRVQRELRNGFHKIGRVHLAALGIDPSAVDFDVRMTVPSAIFELAQMEVLNARADLAARMQEFVSLRWLLTNVFHLSDEEVETVIEQREEDAARAADQNAESEAKLTRAQTGTFERKRNINKPAPSGEMPPPFETPEDEAAAKEAIAQRAHALFGAPRFMSSEYRRSLKERVHGRFTDERLHRGDREGEKRAEEKLEKLLQSNKGLARRLDEVAKLAREAAAMRGRGPVRAKG